ncbi:hypothetical protein CerSpe_240570 [Prunus speciosa]
MALLLLRPPSPPYLRFMALRFLSHSSLHPHFPSSSSSFSSSSLARPSLLFNPQPRTHIPLKGIPSCCVVRNAVAPRAFMSSNPATEAFQGSSGSNAYGYYQIQISKFIKVFMFVGNCCLLMGLVRNSPLVLGS